MGRKKRPFVDKRTSATFRLIARDTSTFPTNGATLLNSDRVFLRVDNNPIDVHGILEEDHEYHPSDVESSFKENQANSIFADAPGDTDEEVSYSHSWPRQCTSDLRDRTSGPLPNDVRREILELGLPDDGYNYLQHLREISNAGAGSSLYQNNKARLDIVPLDVKAYDATRVRISGDESNDSLYTVASKTVNVKVRKVIDPDVARLLDDSDLSRFDSDAEDLEEDFVLKANLPEESEAEAEELQLATSKIDREKGEEGLTRCELEEASIAEDEFDCSSKPRVCRLLDEQFDMLRLREYDNSDSDDGDYMEPKGQILTAELHDTLKKCIAGDLEYGGQYRVPGDYAHEKEAQRLPIQLNDSSDVIRRCREYAEKYCDGSLDDEMLIEVDGSSEESEVWDCETIVSTYSNLDNHPGKIQAPENAKRKFVNNLTVKSIKKVDTIELRGKEKLPMEFLTRARKPFDKVKKTAVTSLEKDKVKPRSEESKVEKKDRKAAVKEERREARRAKKELKGLYRCETHKAQKIAAVSMPSAMHLM
ncbi:hypothetical protein HPP92_015494 [Vanilla planifolia]|uniref:Protein LTV1 homolog n=1 Tax=Vanilla planifolia TaxID=51239 RepID=A0A835UR79_VANPL|nr:hypothetical protein HPP92_015494 [Vanilla planifolia]